MNPIDTFRIAWRGATANKLGLSQAAAGKEVDQGMLAVVAERYRVITDVREAFFELLTLQRRAAILKELVKLAERSVASRGAHLPAVVGRGLQQLRLGTG